MITTKTMTFKKAQATHVDKGNDKIDITQLTYNTSMGTMTHSKAKSTIALSTKLESENTHLLKTMGTHDSY